MKAITLIALLALSACAPMTPEQRAYFQQNPPPRFVPAQATFYPMQVNRPVTTNCNTVGTYTTCTSQ